jgi:hypothetical protein
MRRRDTGSGKALNSRNKGWLLYSQALLPCLRKIQRSLKMGIIKQMIDTKLKTIFFLGSFDISFLQGECLFILFNTDSHI